MKKILGLMVLFFVFGAAQVWACDLCKILTPGQRVASEAEARRLGVDVHVYKKMFAADLKHRGLAGETKTASVISASTTKSKIKVVSAKTAYRFSNEELYVPPTN